MTTSPSTELVDQPLSANGRFNRLSYVGWMSLLGFLLNAAILAVILLSGAGGALMTASSDPSQLANTNAFGPLFFTGIIIILTFALYFIFVFSIRRLHDTNTTGWLSLLLLIPTINFILMLFLFFAPGTQGSNRFGNVRPSKSWEKALAWIYIAFTIFGIILFCAFFAYFMSSMGSMNPVDIPANLPSSTSY